MTQWWRAYNEAVDDPKVQRLAPPLFKHWFNLMCIASGNGGTLPAIGVVAFKLRVAEHKAAEIIAALVDAGLIDKREDGESEPHNWNGRQYKSDVTDPTAAERMRNYRNRKRNATVTVTPPRVQTTDTDTEKEEKVEAAQDAAARKRASRLPKNWMPTAAGVEFAQEKGLSEQGTNHELEKFANYWTAKSGQGATKLDWDATWRNWVLTATERRRTPNERGQSLAEQAHDLADEVRREELARGIGRPNPPFGSH